MGPGWAVLQDASSSGARRCAVRAVVRGFERASSSSSSSSTRAFSSPSRRISFWAESGSSQYSGLALRRSRSSISRSSLARSKTPPERVQPLLQLGQGLCQVVACCHGWFSSQIARRWMSRRAAPWARCMRVYGRAEHQRIWRQTACSSGGSMALSHAERPAGVG